MLKKYLVCLSLLFTSNVLTVNAVTTNQVPASPKVQTARTINEIIDEKALQYNVSATKLTFFIKCESNFNPKALNSNGEFSVGLSQINLDAHTNITREQAEDPTFAISFMAENFSKGKYNMWYNCNQKWLRLNEI